MKPWLLCGYCGDIRLVAAENKEDAALAAVKECGNEPENCPYLLMLEEPYEAHKVKAVTDKDGQEYRVILLPQYKLEAKIDETVYDSVWGLPLPHPKG